MLNGVTFWTEGGSSIGMGHVMRSLSTARVLKASGVPVSFLINDDSSIAVLLAAEGMEFALLPFEGAAPPVITGSVIVMDTRRDVSRLAAALKMQGKWVVMVDNLTACGASDCVVMPTLTFRPDIWAEMGEELPGGQLSNIKSGGDYVIIGENFIRGRAIGRILARPQQESGKRPFSGEALKILVTMGGADPNFLAEKVVGALKGVEGIEVTVVIGPASTPSPGFRRVINSRSDTFTFLTDVKDLAPHAAAADFAFSAMGVTVYELAYMGVPSVLIANYPEDALDIETLESMGICRSLGYHRDVTEDGIRRVVGHFMGNRGGLKVISSNAVRLIDGRGAERIAGIISELYKHDKSLGERGAERAAGKVSNV